MTTMKKNSEEKEEEEIADQAFNQTPMVQQLQCMDRWLFVTFGQYIRQGNSFILASSLNVWSKKIIFVGCLCVCMKHLCILHSVLVRIPLVLPLPICMPNAVACTQSSFGILHWIYLAAVRASSLWFVSRIHSVSIQTWFG